MKCPVCKNKQMVVLELNQIEIDYCHNCNGIWLDSGELELLLEDCKGKEDVLNNLIHDKKNKEKKHRCPICLKKMDKVVFEDKNSTGSSQIIVDKCKKLHGIWFDKGELEQIIKAGSIDTNNKILQLLQDMFGYKYK